MSRLWIRPELDIYLTLAEPRSRWAFSRILPWAPMTLQRTSDYRDVIRYGMILLHVAVIFLCPTHDEGFWTPPSHVTLYPTPFSRTSLTFAEPPSSSLAPNVSERTLYYSRKKDRLENFLDIRLFVWLIQASEISLGLLQSVLRRFTKYRYNLIMQNV